MDSRRSGIEKKIDGRIEKICFWVVAFFEQVAPSLSYRSPNVKDEPRPWLARRVRDDDLDSGVSFRDS